MCSSPDGYGSISTTYVLRRSASPGLGVRRRRRRARPPRRAASAARSPWGRTARSSSGLRVQKSLSSREARGKLSRRRAALASCSTKEAASLRAHASTVPCHGSRRGRASSSSAAWRATAARGALRDAARRLLRGGRCARARGSSARRLPDALVVYGTKAFPNVALMRAPRRGRARRRRLHARRARLRAARRDRRATASSCTATTSPTRSCAPQRADALVVLDAPDEAERAAAAGVAARARARDARASRRRRTRRSAPGTAAPSSGSTPDDALAAVARARDAGLEVAGPARPRRLAARRRACAPAGGRAARRLRGALPRRARLDARARRRRRRLRHPPRRGRARAAGRGARALDRRGRRAGVGDARAAGAAADRSSPAARSSGPPAFTLYRVGASSGPASRRYVAIDGGMSDNPRPAALRRPLHGPAREPRRRGGGRRALHDRRQALRVRRRPDRPRRAARAAPGRPARGSGDGRLHARDGLELQRRAAAGGRPRRGRRALA